MASKRGKVVVEFATLEDLERIYRWSPSLRTRLSARRRDARPVESSSP